MDLDETLIHYDEQAHTEQIEACLQKFNLDHNRQPTHSELNKILPKITFNIRPYSLELLKQLSKYYEIVVFTAAEQEYADEVLDALDPNKYIKHRLYRQHLTQLK